MNTHTEGRQMCSATPTGLRVLALQPFLVSVAVPGEVVARNSVSSEAMIQLAPANARLVAPANSKMLADDGAQLQRSMPVNSPIPSRPVVQTGPQAEVPGLPTAPRIGNMNRGFLAYTWRHFRCFRGSYILRVK
jgi:hypothetical protein